MNLVKMTRKSGRIIRKRQLSDGYCPGIYGFMTDWLSIWWFEVPFSLQFLCFDSCFPRLRRFFVIFWIATSFKRNIHLFPVELAIYCARFSGSVVFFLSSTRLRTWLLLKEEFFVINILLARTLLVFTNATFPLSRM